MPNHEMLDKLRRVNARETPSSSKLLRDAPNEAKDWLLSHAQPQQQHVRRVVSQGPQSLRQCHLACQETHIDNNVQLTLTKTRAPQTLCQLGHRGIYKITQRHPAVGSSPSSLVFELFPVFAFSSSSTTSWGLTVI